jgi:hypothetical protein
VLTDASVSGHSPSTRPSQEDPAITVKMFSMSDASVVIDPDHAIMKFDESKCAYKRPIVRVNPPA